MPSFLESLPGRRRRPKPPIELSGDSDLCDQRIAAALLETVLRWREWCHRRVDRYEAEGGNRGRTKQSIDMTLPADARLAYDAAQRGLMKASTVRGLVVAPLAILAKKPLHEFDVALSGAGSVPMLTRTQNEALVVGMLVEGFERILGSKNVHPRLNAALTSIVAGSGSAAWDVATELTDRGEFDGDGLFDPGLIAGTDLYFLTRDLASGFLLCVLLPSTVLGTRSLVKISHLWRTDVSKSGWWSRHVQSVHDFELTLTAASDTESYHFEFIVPRGLSCRYLAIPRGSAPGDRHLLTEKRDTTVHLHANYMEPPGSARVVLTSLGRGPRVTVFIWLLATVGLCWGLVSLANFDQLVSGSGSGVSLLLSLPAALLAVGAARSGQSLADTLNAAPRLAAILCAALLFIEAAGPVVMPDAHSLWVYWQATAWAATALLALAVVQSVLANVAMNLNLKNHQARTVVAASNRA